MRRYWVIGASKPLGIALVEALRRSYSIQAFTRRPTNAVRNPVIVDLANYASWSDELDRQFELGAPDGVVFCQRYRPEVTDSDAIGAIKRGLDVELAPVLALLEKSRSIGNSRMSVVLLSSVAGQQIHVDLPLSYHVLKATTLISAQFLAAASVDFGVRVNCVVLGEFKKYKLEDYSHDEKNKFKELSRFSFDGEVCSVADIVSTVEFLLSDRSRAFNGQLINLCGNLSNMSAESLVASGTTRKTSVVTINGEV